MSICINCIEINHNNCINKFPGNVYRCTCCLCQPKEEKDIGCINCRVSAHKYCISKVNNIYQCACATCWPEKKEKTVTKNSILPFNYEDWRTIQFVILNAINDIDPDEENISLSFENATKHEDGEITIAVYRWNGENNIKQFVANIGLTIDYTEKNNG